MTTPFPTLPIDAMREAFVRTIKAENAQTDPPFRWSLKQHWTGPHAGFADEQLQKLWLRFKAGWQASISGVALQPEGWQLVPIDAMREKFEAVALSKGWHPSMLERDKTGDYYEYEADISWQFWQAALSGVALHPKTDAKPDCNCRKCRPVTLGDMRMVVCPTCGNKRCPHAADHIMNCTNSNEPGQPGSDY